VHVPFHSAPFLVAGKKEVAPLFKFTGVLLSQLPQDCAPNHLKLRGMNGRKRLAISSKTWPPKKSSGQLMDEPVMRAFAVDYSTFRCSRAGRCKVILWAPLSRRFRFGFTYDRKRPERNAHCAAIRQSLHCLIAARTPTLHLGFLCGTSPFLYDLAVNTPVRIAGTHG